jgi:hypothetical protein
MENEIKHHQLNSNLHNNSFNIEFILQLILMHNEGIKVAEEMIKIIHKIKNICYFVCTPTSILD